MTAQEFAKKWEDVSYNVTPNIQIYHEILSKVYMILQTRCTTLFGHDIGHDDIIKSCASLTGEYMLVVKNTFHYHNVIFSSSKLFSEDILKNQKIIIGLDTFSTQHLRIYQY